MPKSIGFSAWSRRTIATRGAFPDTARFALRVAIVRSDSEAGPWLHEYRWLAGWLVGWLL